ncbi:MAG: glycosyltransferase family 4 protein [Vicinamibacterales bacterium]
MRILYAAIDQMVPGSHGGAVHVTSVAEGLAARGHEVHALVTRPSGRNDSNEGVHWHAMAPALGLRQLRALRAGAVTRLADEIKPDVIMERYYNFGGEGILAARRLGIFSVLEVNAPVIDYAGSPKALLDRALLIQPMRRWREWQCSTADLIVTPSPKIIPPQVPASRILQAEWGADTVRFHPGAGTRDEESRDTVAVFVGAFRKWHGAIHLVEAIKRLRERGRRDIRALFVGDGPELPAARRAAEGLDGVRFVGALPHERVPQALAESHIGVAPFDVAEHPPLATDFYWSPLKVFEYMASGLPVAAPRIPRLESIVRDGQEGVLYDASAPLGLAAAIEQLADPTLRGRLGQAARDRVVEHFSWARHCEQLDRAIQSARGHQVA